MQSFALYLLNHHAEDFLLHLLVLGQEHQSCTILSFLWYGDALQEDELMRNLEHDTGPVSIIADLCPAVPHVLQHVQSVVNELMAFVAVDVYHHPYTTGIMFVYLLI